MDTSDVDDVESVETNDDELSRAVTLGEAPTTVTFYSEAGLWGDSLTRSLPASGDNESTLLITKTEVQNANLLRRISSLRLSCGSRAGQLALFNAYNTGSTLSTWSPSARAKPIYCSPGETVTMNLHAEAPTFADAVASVYLVRHARDAGSIAFSTFLSNAWEIALEDLPSSAEARGGPQLVLQSNTRFALRQDLTLDDWKCGDRGANFSLAAQMRQDATFSVFVISTYVDTGWGDAWGCRTKMEAALKTAAADAASDLQDGLEQLILLAGDHPRYYFVPNWSLREFDLAAGGEPAKPLENFPGF